MANLIKHSKIVIYESRVVAFYGQYAYRVVNYNR